MRAHVRSLRLAVISLGTNRFELRERLGRGGAGVVYEAYDREHERAVALKLLPEMSAADIGRLKHEFRALSDVAHPNLVRLYELVSDGAQWFFTMELVRGSMFLDHVRTPDSKPPPDMVDAVTRPVPAEPPTPLVSDSTLKGNAHAPEWNARTAPPARSGAPRIPQLRDALAQLAQGVTAIHGAGKLHCDLKPHNVLVTHAGRVVVLDFGLVTDVRSSLAASIKLGEQPVSRVERSARLTERDTSVSGTPAYMAPEQAAGERVTEASDWYAVGVMLYEALTGRLPFDGPVRELMRRKQISDPLPPDVRAPHLPEDLCTLCMDLLQRDPAARPSGSEVLKRAGKSSRVSDSGAPIAISSLPPSQRAQPLVGRDREIAELESAVAVAERKQPIVLYVHGQAGIGKTRLLQHVLQRVAERPATVVLAGRCYERERLPFKAVDSVIDALTSYLFKLEQHESAALLPRDIHSLSRVFPALLRVPSIAAVKRPAFEAPDPHEVRRRAFAALKELLRSIAERATLIVHIDDLHWGDFDSASLLIDLLEPPDPPPMLFIASFRSTDATNSPCVRALLSRFPADNGPEAAAGRSGTVRELPLAPLSTEDSVALVQALSPRLSGAEAIAKDAAGNPFFVAQLVHFAVTTDHPGARDDPPRISRTTPDTPITLEQVLRERMQLLPKSALDLLEVVSVAGRPIPRDIAVGAAEILDADSALAVLRAGAWLRSQGPRKDDVVECYHDRVREVVALSIAPPRLRERHEAIALKLEQTGHASPVDLAEHFRAAGQNDKAALYAQRAAENATYALAFDDAARWYEMALALGTTLPSAHGASANLQALRVKLAESLANAGRTAAAAESYLLAARDAEPHFVLELRRRAAEQWLVGGHIDEGVQALRSVLEVGSMRLAKTPRSALLSLLTRRMRVKLRGLHWQRRSHTEIPPAQLMQIDTCWSVATTLGTVDTIRAADFQARHLLLALSAGEPYRVARALAVEAGFAATAGGKNRARAEAVGKAAREIALEMQDEHPHALGLSMTISGMTGYLMGEWASALRDCDAAERILLERCTGVLWELTQARRFALSALTFMGNLAELSKRSPKLLTEARERGQLYAETDLRSRLMTFMWLAQGQPELAEQNAEEALQRWSQQGFHLQHYNRVLALAQCSMYRGDARAALTRLDETWPLLENSMLMRIQALRVEIWHARGRAMLAALRKGRSAADVQRIAHRIAGERMAWTRPLAAILMAGVHRHRGQLDAARFDLERAAAGFDAVDMQLYAAVARMRLGALIGGDQGVEVRAKAQRFFDAQGIVDPDAFTRLLAAGFDR
jgi:serine/threonine protein kinase